MRWYRACYTGVGSKNNFRVSENSCESMSEGVGSLIILLAQPRVLFRIEEALIVPLGCERLLIG